MSVRFYHGGAPGLRPGDIIEPRPAGDERHYVDGCETCEARRRGEQRADDDLDPHLVYVTTDREYARLYASGYPRGGLYRVEVADDEPMAPSPDPEPVPSWGVRQATVVAVLDPLVRMTPAELRRLWKRTLAR